MACITVEASNEMNKFVNTIFTGYDVYHSFIRATFTCVLDDGREGLFFGMAIPISFQLQKVYQLVLRIYALCFEGSCDGVSSGMAIS